MSGSILIKPGTRAPKTTNYPAWEYALLQKKGWPVNAVTLIGLNLWAKSEGVEATANNPLAITNPNQEFGPDEGTINSAGVAKFSSLGQGVDATSNFLDAPDYAAIDAAFRQGTSLNAIFHAINSSPWCSNCQGGQYPTALAKYARAGTLALGSIPIFHGGSPSGSDAVAGGTAESRTSFYQCNSSSTIVGGLGFNVLDACQAKAIVGGLLTAVGALTMVFGVSIILAGRDVQDLIGLDVFAKILRGNGGGVTPSPSPAPPKPTPTKEPKPPKETLRDRRAREKEESAASFENDLKTRREENKRRYGREF